jgi:hypothetical protein
MSDRHGIERLRWLEEPDTDTTYSDGSPVPFSRLTMMSAERINVEVAYALIEELHDALLKLDHPIIVMPQSPHGV